jgi:hypothetical protein
MSDLQVSLLIIGLVVVGGVTAFNWFQQWRLRRRLEQAFDGKHEDVLLRPAPAREPAARDVSLREQGRVEPQLGSVPRVESGEQPRPSAHSALRVNLPPVPDFDPDIDFIVTVDAPEPISAAGLAELHTKAAQCGRRFRVLGLNMQTRQWEEAARLSGGRYSHLAMALQLVSRRGAVDLGALTTFCAAAQDCGERFSAEVSCPNIEATLGRARELDAYCADVDIAIGVNIIAPEGEKLGGIRIRTAAESAGLKLEPQGTFQYRDDSNRTLFTLDNHEPAPFLPEQIKHLSTDGVTLLLDVPRVEDGAGALEIMLRTGVELATALGAKLVDDNRRPLTETSIRAIQQQLETITSKMQARGMAPGTERALRLFS